MEPVWPLPPSGSRTRPETWDGSVPPTGQPHPALCPARGTVWTGFHAEPQKATLLEAGKSSAPFRKMRSTLDEGGP